MLNSNTDQISSGFAQVEAAANDTLGIYQVLASAAGAPDGVNYLLINLPGTLKPFLLFLPAVMR